MYIDNVCKGCNVYIIEFLYVMYRDRICDKDEMYA